MRLLRFERLRWGSIAGLGGLLLSALLLTTAPAATGRVPVYKSDPSVVDALPGGPRMIERENQRLEAARQRQKLEHRLLGPHHASRKSLARLVERGLGPARQAPRSGFAPAADAGVDTLKVLLVRIGFETDLSGDLTSVTTDGDFQLAPDPSVRIDPPPHDRAFFESHLYGMSEYYRLQSGGRLVIQAKVLPEGDRDCYKLRDLSDYAPGAEGFWSLEGLESLVVDMIELADGGTQADGSVNLADFDDDDPLARVIFVHSGSDWQSDVLGDSPNDIPSFNVMLGEPVALTSLDSETGLPGLFSECSVIPETTTQDGYYGSIAAVMYHEFGHALGLPDLYDTETGLTGVGVWDLMDSGTNVAGVVGLPSLDDPEEIDTFYVTGVLPPSLSVWSKWFLGWVDPACVPGEDRAFSLPAIQVPRSDYFRYVGASASGLPYNFDVSDPQAVIGGASPGEFFLMENRWVPYGPADFPDATGIGFVRDEETGVLLYLAGDGDRNTGMYDYFLPPGGMLVWHADQPVIEAHLYDNTVNAGRDGLRLVEADGIRDVGLYASFVEGFYGSETDVFHAGNASFLGQEGTPNSRAWDRSWTGLELDDISENLPTMNFTARVSPLTAIPELEVPAASGSAARRINVDSVTPFPLGGAKANAAAVIVFAEDPAPGDPCHLFALTLDGAPAVAAAAELPEGAFARLDAPLAGPPIVLDADGGSRLIVATRDGSVRAFSDAAPSMPDPIWEVSVGDTLLQAPSVGIDEQGEARLLVLAAGPAALLLDDEGGLIGDPLPLDSEVSAQPLAVSLPGLQGDRFVVAHPYGSELLAWDESGLFAEAESWKTDSMPPPYSGDVPGPDIRMALVPVPGGARAIAFGGAANLAWDLTDAASAPAPWTSALDEPPAGELAVADLDADGRDDVIVVAAGAIHALSAEGVELDGWPAVLAARFPLDETVSFCGPVVVFDGTGDGVNEVYAVTDAGHLVGFDARGNLIDRTPFLWGVAGDASVTAVDSGPTGGKLMWLAGEGGWSSARPGARRDNGRLVGYLPPSAVAASTVTSQWLGPRGGPMRYGPAGTAADLGPASPAIDQAGRFFAYPNPVTEGTATFRFHAESDGVATVSVYNLEGEQVDRFSMSVVGGVMNEYPWRLDGLASGVYLCRLRIEGDGETRTRMLRLAVER